MKRALAPGQPIERWRTQAKKQKIEYSDDKESRCVRAILRNVESGWWATKSITYVVYYNSDGIIVKCDIRDVYTGP
jgi:hypothetical protein